MGTHNCLSPMEPRHEENRGKVLPMELKSRNRCGKEPRNVRDIGQNWLWLSSSVAAATQTLSCPPELPGSPESSLVRQKERRKGALGWLLLGQFFSGGDNRALWRQPALSPSFPTRTQWPLKGSPRCLWNGWNERVSKRRCKLCPLSPVSGNHHVPSVWAKASLLILPHLVILLPLLTPVPPQAAFPFCLLHARTLSLPAPSASPPPPPPFSSVHYLHWMTNS